MRGSRAMLLLLTSVLACRSGKTVPEPGAVLLQVKCPADAPVPDELRAWVYDDGGVLWQGVRIPAQGPLVAEHGQSLGTILIAPGTIRGGLRIHLRGYAAGERILDGMVSVSSLAAGERTYTLLLATAAPPDADADGVPDTIDDCPGVANPAQGGCLTPAPGDAAVADAPPSTRDGVPDGGDCGDAGADAVIADLPVQPDLASDVMETGAEPGDGRTDDGDAMALTGPEVADLDPADHPQLGVDANDPADAGQGDGGGKSQGQSCAADAECASGACADGVCCTSACLGPCRSCNQPNATGVCQGYAAGTDPESECGGGTCNGVGACGSAPPLDLANGYLCSSASQCHSGYCVDGVCCDSACTTACLTCGGGTCVPVKRADDVPECTGSMTCNPAGKCAKR